MGGVLGGASSPAGAISPVHAAPPTPCVACGLAGSRRLSVSASPCRALGGGRGAEHAVPSLPGREPVSPSAAREFWVSSRSEAVLSLRRGVPADSGRAGVSGAEEQGATDSVLGAVSSLIFLLLGVWRTVLSGCGVCGLCGWPCGVGGGEARASMLRLSGAAARGVPCLGSACQCPSLWAWGSRLATGLEPARVNPSLPFRARASRTCALTCSTTWRILTSVAASPGRASRLRACSKASLYSPLARAIVALLARCPLSSPSVAKVRTQCGHLCAPSRACPGPPGGAASMWGAGEAGDLTTLGFVYCCSASRHDLLADAPLSSALLPSSVSTPWPAASGTAVSTSRGCPAAHTRTGCRGAPAPR